MNLIRNGGFERGTIDFWAVETNGPNGTLEIDNSNQKYGSYCGKLTPGFGIVEDILSTDYIECLPDDLIGITGWAKSIATQDVSILIYTFDGDYSLIGAERLNSRTMDGTYLMLNAQYVPPLDCAYIRVGYGIHTSVVTDPFYLDGFQVNNIRADNSMNGRRTLLELSDITSSGNTTSNEQDMEQFSTYYAELYAAFGAGSSPTLDVSVYEIGEFDQEILLGSFSTFTAGGEERISLPHTQGNGMYIRYTLGGTNPEFYFGAVVVGKR